MKITSRFDYPIVGSNEHFTEPNQSYSVRQIIEQYSRGELMAKTFNPSDNIDDDLFSDDQLEYVQSFEDEFEAFDHLQANQYELRKKKHETLEDQNESNSGDPKEETP